MMELPASSRPGNEAVKKKILIMVDWFVPGYKAGGPIQSCVNLCLLLKDEFDIYVLTTDTDHGERVPYEGIVADQWQFNKALGVQIYYAKKSHITLRQLTEQVKLINAEVVYLNHLFSPRFVVYPLWLKYRSIIESKVVVCPRGALYNSALSLKSYKKRPLLMLYKWLGIHKRIIFHATNQREKDAIQEYFPGSDIIIADNLPGILQPDFKSVIKQPGKLLCIFIARIVPIKNLLFLIRVLQSVKEEVTLTIVGPIENEDYWMECTKFIAQLPANIRVNYIGPKENNVLADLIQQHHLFVLPTTGENFGHSIFEALQAGRPVLISNQTPWLNLQSENAGWDLPLDEPGNFSKIISLMANCTQQQFELYANAAWSFAKNFDWDKSKQQYRILFS